MKYRLFLIPVAAAAVVAVFALTGSAQDPDPVVETAVAVAAETPPPAVVVEPAVAPPEVTPAATSEATEVETPAPVDMGGPVDDTLIPEPATPPAGPTTRCEIVHAVVENFDAWGARGVTGLPVGTVVVYTLTVDGTTRTIPLTVREGSVMVDGSSYGDGYAGGANVFGSTQVDMPILEGPHGPVSASVTLDGSTLCSA